MQILPKELTTDRILVIERRRVGTEPWPRNVETRSDTEYGAHPMM